MAKPPRAKPPRQQVNNEVRKIIATFSNQPERNIRDSHVLSKAPLHLNSTSLNFLTISLRGYIKNINSSAKISTSEVKKADLTVKDLVDLVFSKL